MIQPGSKRFLLNHYARCIAPKCMVASVVYATPTMPLCEEHAYAAWRSLGQRLRKRAASRTAALPRSDRGAATRPSIVYYGLHEGYVKIGVTTSPQLRWERLRAEYGSFTVLVAEPGGAKEETLRHAEFVELRVRQTELFHYRDALVEHVESLRAERPDWRRLAHEAHAAYKMATSSKRGALTIP